jgi:hypothetical protein
MFAVVMHAEISITLQQQYGDPFREYPPMKSNTALEAQISEPTVHLNPDNLHSGTPRTGSRVTLGVGGVADHPQCLHYACMSIQITIRDVPEKVRDELASRAALQGKSMQEYLRAELVRLAARPSIENWLEQVRKRKRASQTRVSASEILQSRDTDRR